MDPIPLTFQVFSLKLMDCDINVVKLICHQWKVFLVRSLSSDVECEAILAMPLSLRMPPDKLILHYDKEKCFNVRSIYHVAYRYLLEKGNSVGTSTGVSCFTGLWMKL